MKNILLITLVFIGLKNFAQTVPFPTPDMRYGEIHYGDWSIGFYPTPVLYQYTKDTAMLGNTYSQFNTTRNHQPSNYPFYTRNASGKIYYYSNGYEDLIYDFTLQVNDTLSFNPYAANIGSPYGYEIYQLVSITNVTLLNNQTRRLFIWDYVGDVFGQTTHSGLDTIRWIEGIGDIDRGLIPHADFEGGHSSFVCASDTSGRLWENENFPGACDTLLVCHAAFSVVPSSIAHQWYAVNHSTGSASFTYIWSWGDGNSSTGHFVSHTYSGPGYYNICLTVADNTGCSDTYCDSSTYIFKTDEAITVNVVDELPTGISTLAGDMPVLLQPNPATGNLFIETDGMPLTEVNIYNITGSRIWQGRHLQSKQIDISSLQAGMYIVEVKSNDKIAKRKLLKM